MIARHDTHTEKADIWGRLSETMDPSRIQWRQDGKVFARDGKFSARFVAYVEANDVRERLDSVVPGEWDLTLELLPPMTTSDGEVTESFATFKARLQILGVIREDVGSGRDYKAAATDAFKRAAVRFGIAHELYSFEQNWVQVDSDSKYPKPLEDPGVAYQRRYGGKQNGNGGQQATPRPTQSAATARSAAGPTATASSSIQGDANGSGHGEGDPNTPSNGGGELPSCPKCGGKMWDNRMSKRNPKAPDYKCRDKSCDGVIWPGQSGNGKGKESGAKAGSRKQKQEISMGPSGPYDDGPPPEDYGGPPDDNDIPF